MIDGVLTLRQVLSHPMTVIGCYGLLKFCEILMKGVSRRRYQFLQIVFVLGESPSHKSGLPRLILPQSSCNSRSCLAL